MTTQHKWLGSSWGHLASCIETRIEIQFTLWLGGMALAPAIARGLKEHVTQRILHSGSKAQDNGDSRNGGLDCCVYVVCRTPNLLIAYFASHEINQAIPCEVGCTGVSTSGRTHGLHMLKQSFWLMGGNQRLTLVVLNWFLHLPTSAPWLLSSRNCILYHVL